MRNSNCCRPATCRRARHELLGPDGTARVGGAPVDDGGARALEKQYAECVSLCRSKRAVELQVAALAELGGLQLRAGAAGRAAESWVEAVDATFQTYDVVASWPSHIDGVVSTLGLAAVGRCIALLGQLAAQTTRVQLEQRPLHRGRGPVGGVRQRGHLLAS